LTLLIERHTAWRNEYLRIFIYAGDDILVMAAILSPVVLAISRSGQRASASRFPNLSARRAPRRGCDTMAASVGISLEAQFTSYPGRRLHELSQCTGRQPDRLQFRLDSEHRRTAARTFRPRVPSATRFLPNQHLPRRLYAKSIRGEAPSCRSQQIRRFSLSPTVDENVETSYCGEFQPLTVWPISTFLGSPSGVRSNSIRTLWPRAGSHRRGCRRRPLRPSQPCDG